jgi:hypothetical protein
MRFRVAGTAYIIDTEAPQILSIQFSPFPVELADAPFDLSVILRLTDNAAGIQNASFVVSNFFLHKNASSHISLRFFFPFYFLVGRT